MPGPGSADDGQARHAAARRALAAGDRQRALALVEEAARLAPDRADILYDLGTLLDAAGRRDEAIAALRHAVRLAPAFVEAHNNLGNALAAQGDHDAAIAHLTWAVELRPDLEPLRMNLARTVADQGNRLVADGRAEAGVALLQRAVALQPAAGDLHNNLGVGLRALGDPGRAWQSFDVAVRLAPDLAEARYNRGAAALAMGRFELGWADFAARTAISSQFARRFDAPAWTGDPLDARVLLVVAEQGLGDIIQFARYIPLLAEQAARVVLLAPAGLARLLSSLVGGERIQIVAGGPPPPYDAWCWLMDLPGLCGTTLASVPAPIPYLAADPDRVAAWRTRLADGGDGRRIGVFWRGSSYDRARDLPLEALAALKRPGLRLIALQTDPADMAAAAAAGLEPLPGLDAGPDAFLDSAAVLQCLDLTIGTDTALAHLAGALGRPAWILLKRAPDWRWLLDRTDSPWYPSLRLFRQAVAGDWSVPVTALATALDAWHATPQAVVPTVQVALVTNGARSSASTTASSSVSCTEVGTSTAASST